MPTLPSSVMDPLWSQFSTLIPDVVDEHPLGCHRPRVPDRLVFERLVARLVLGGSYTKHADETVSATTLRTRRDEWITAGIFTALEQAGSMPTTPSSAWTWNTSALTGAA